MFAAVVVSVNQACELVRPRHVSAPPSLGALLGHKESGLLLVWESIVTAVSLSNLLGLACWPCWI